VDPQSGATGESRDLLSLIHSYQQVPQLRIAIGKANRNAPLGMTGSWWAGKTLPLRRQPCSPGP